MSKITGLITYAGKFDPRIVEIDSDNFLDEVYKIIDCRCIDIVTGIHNDNYVDMVVDDEGLLKDTAITNPIAWYLYSKCDPDYPIVGNVVLVGTNDEGETVDIPQVFLDELDEIVMSARDCTFRAIFNID